MRDALYVAVILALAMALIFVGSRDRTDPETERWKQEAEAHQADADYWREAGKEAREKIVADSIRSDSIINAQRARTEQAERETDEVIASLPDTIQQIVRPIIDAERAEHRAEVTALEERHERAMTLIRGELRAKEREAVSLRATIAANDSTIARLEDRLAPTIDLGFIKLNMRCSGGVGPGAQVDHKGEVHTSLARAYCQIET